MTGRSRARRLGMVACSVLLVVATAAMAQDDEWIPITGADTLRQFMSGLSGERKVRGGVSRGEYHADGTGVVHSWGESFPRTWTVEGDDRVCIKEESVRTRQCYEIERNAADPNLYRVHNVSTGKLTRFRGDGGGAAVPEEGQKVPSEGGAGVASADEIAAALSNPNNPMGTMNFNFDYVEFDGDVPGADDQSSFVVGFQPSLPYPLGGGKNFFVRPAFPIIIDQPVLGSDGEFDSKGVELGDIGYDAAVGFSLPSGNVAILGVAGAFPTATDDAVGSDQWLLGPEAAFFLLKKWGVVGVFASHLWDVAGEDSFDTNITSGQYIYAINLKQGWQISAAPTWSYNHEADSDNAVAFPLGIGIAKTAIVGGRPWKMNLQYLNFVVAPDGFGAKQQIRFSIGPVVKLPWKGRGGS